MFTRGKKGKGIALTEIMISVLILGIAISAMLGSFVIGRFSTSKAKHRIQALNHVRAAMEQYLNNASTYTLPDGDIKTLNGTCSVVSAYHSPGLRKVTVTISWNERSRGGQTVVVSEELVTIERD